MRAPGPRSRQRPHHQAAVRRQPEGGQQLARIAGHVPLRQDLAAHRLGQHTRGDLRRAYRHDGRAQARHQPVGIAAGGHDHAGRPGLAGLAACQPLPGFAAQRLDTRAAADRRAQRQGHARQATRVGQGLHMAAARIQPAQPIARRAQQARQFVGLQQARGHATFAPGLATALDRAQAAAGERGLDPALVAGGAIDAEFVDQPEYDARRLAAEAHQPAAGLARVERLDYLGILLQAGDHLPVVAPGRPQPGSAASSTITRLPSRHRRMAADRPVNPAPMISTSAAWRPSRDGAPAPPARWPPTMNRATARVRPAVGRDSSRLRPRHRAARAGLPWRGAPGGPSVFRLAVSHDA